MTQTLAQLKAAGITQAVAAAAQLLQPTRDILHIADASAQTTIDLLGQRVSTIVIGILPAALTIKVDGDNFDEQGANDFKFINNQIGVACAVTLQFVHKGEVKDTVQFTTPDDEKSAISITVTKIPAAPSEDPEDATPYLLCTELNRGA